MGLSGEESFEQIYNTFWKDVYLFCFHQLQDSDIAKDLTQDIFKSLWERRDELIISTSIEHYLIKAAKYKVLEHVRNDLTKRRLNESVANGYSESVNSTEEHLSYKELNSRIHTLITALPVKCKRVFTMSRMDGMPNRRISTQLGISERAVEYHISKALVFIRKNLEQQFGGFLFFVIFAVLK